MKKKIFVTITLIVSLFLAACTSGTAIDYSGADEVDESSAEHTLATCLTESGAKFYGAYWCPHCQEQKDIFGAAVDAIPYVECEENQDVCAAAGITGYPTWIFGDGTVVQGAQSLAQLAIYSNCRY